MIKLQSYYLAFAVMLLLAMGLALPVRAVAKQAGKNAKIHITIKKYNLARARYNAIKFSPELAKSAEAWRGAARAFIRAYKADTYSSRAPASLLTLGHIYYKLYKRFGKADDLHEALSYYDDVVSLFPKHPYADDALYHTARIYALEQGNYKKAALVLARLLAIYPNGDMLRKAAGDLQKWKIAQAKKKAVAVAQKKRVDAAKSVQKKAKAPVSALARMLDLRHWSTKTYTRVVIEVSKPIKYKDFLLKEDGGRPRRLYINLDNCQVPRKMQKKITVKDGLLQRVRSAQYKPTIGRVVLDTQSISDYKIFSLDKPFRIVIDVKGGSAAVEPRGKTICIPNAPTLAQQLGLGIKRIILDPGHGGKDPGAIGVGGLLEKDVVLKVAKKVARKLRRDLGCEVILTRTRDVFIPLEERTAIANTKEGDLFVSIHANAAHSSKARGIEIYYLDLTNNKRDMQLAASENATSARNISDLQKILSSLMKNCKKEESARLAKIVNKNLLLEMNKRYGGIKSHGVKKAPFIVLIGAQMPSILAEIAFVSNPTDAKRLRDDKYLDALADSLSVGIIKYAMDLSMAN
jgi:N-acetylmuramoyl-L-alanine amidase